MDSDESARRWYARELVQTYFRMLTVGCGAAACTNAQCRSSSNDVAAAAVRSIWLATHAPIPLCIPLSGSYDSAAQDEIDQLEEENQHERPETDEDANDTNNNDDGDDGDDDGIERSEGGEAASEAVACHSTPRRRLSSAVELDLTLAAASINARSSAPGRRPHSRDRKLSLAKQKLLDAITKSFPSAPGGANRSLEVELRQSSGR